MKALLDCVAQTFFHGDGKYLHSRDLLLRCQQDFVAAARYTNSSDVPQQAAWDGCSASVRTWRCFHRDQDKFVLCVNVICVSLVY